MKKYSNLPFRERFKKKFNHLIYQLKSLSFVKHILIFYLFITIIGSLLLMIPVMRNKDVDYVDLLFTSASAFSDTGLTTVITSETFSAYGQAIIAVLILIGGVGWFALKMYIINIIFGRPISFNSRQTLSTERGNSRLGVTRHLIKVSVTILFILLIISSIALSLYFYFLEPDLHPFVGDNSSTQMIIGDSPYQNVQMAIRYGFFHSISAINNAGFDIMGGHSLQPYYNHFGLQIVFIVLFVIGGIGYPVIYDIYMWAKSKYTKEPFRWSLFTKLSCTVYVVITLIGVGTTFALEMSAKEYQVFDGLNNVIRLPMWKDPRYGDTGHKVMALIFNTMSTRNAGFATIEMDHLSSGTLFVYTFLMFVGSAPSSTAGGIRTTTMGIIVVALWSKLRGKKQVTMFNRSIKPDTVSRSFIVFASALLVTLVVLIIGISSYHEYGGRISQEKSPFNHLLFEVSSAFGTTGLSTGITADLSIPMKIGLILLMFIGQLGVSSSILVWDSKQNKYRKYAYVEEDVTVG